MVGDVTNSAFCIKAFGHVTLAFANKKKWFPHTLQAHGDSHVLHDVCAALVQCKLGEGPLKRCVDGNTSVTVSLNAVD